jgi:phenylpropionate dioxygenase-like ring-hydroxylating dioxygenase large terminal subunit
MNQPARPAAAQIDTALWESHWHLLCHRSEVASSGEYVLFNVAGQEVVAFHDGGEVIAFDNRCPHRGTRIYEGTHGKQRFVCKYHGWSFAKGRLFIPSRDTFTQCDPTEAKLNVYRTEWLGDFLFIARAPLRPLREQLAGIDQMLERISLSIDRQSDFNRYDYRCNWKHAVENALDQYHVAIIHRDTLNKLQMQPARDVHLGINNVSYAGVGDDRLTKRLRGLRRFFDLQFQQEEYMAIHIFPFTFLTSTFGYSYSLQHFYPAADPDHTHFTSRFYQSRLSSKVSAEAMASYFASTVAVNHDVFREDADICAMVPTDAWSPEPPRFVSAGEEKIVHFRRLMANAIDRGDPALNAEPSRLDAAQ